MKSDGKKTEVYGRERPAHRFSLEFDRGDMRLVFDGREIEVEEEDGKYWISKSRMLGGFESLSDLYDHVTIADLEPITNVGSSAFRLRKNFLDLTEYEKVRFAEAFNYAYESGLIKKAANGHNKYADRFHRVPQFFTMA